MQPKNKAGRRWCGALLSFCGGQSKNEGYLPGRVTTQFVPPLLLDPLSTATEEPDPPGDKVVVPETPLRPVVMVVVFEPRSRPVTTWQGWLFFTTVPFGPELTATLSAKTGTVTNKPSIMAETAVLWCRMGILPKAEARPAR